MSSGENRFGNYVLWPRRGPIFMSVKRDSAPITGNNIGTMRLAAHDAQPNMSTHDSDPRAESDFMRNQIKLEEIRLAGGIGPYSKRLNLESGFAKTANVELSCSDERMPGTGAHDLGGPLFALFVLRDDRKALAQLYAKNGIKSMKSHQGCGAAKAAFKAWKGLPAAANPSWGEVDAFAKQETEKFCRDAQGFGFDIKYGGHITEHQMSSGGHFHPGMAIYLDDVGGFDWRNLSEALPQGYTVSGKISTNPVEGVKSLLSLVAFGKGNAGDRIKEAIARGENVPKFQVNVVAVNQSEGQKRIGQIKAAIASESYAKYIEYGVIEKPAGVEAWK